MRFRWSGEILENNYNQKRNPNKPPKAVIATRFDLNSIQHVKGALSRNFHKT